MALPSIGDGDGNPGIPKPPPVTPITWKGTFRSEQGITVNATIGPYVRVSFGPSGQSANFQSNVGSGQSNPITITFDQDIKEFSIFVVGPSFRGNFVRGYDINNNMVAFAEAAVSPGGGAAGTDTTVKVTINQATNWIRRVVLEPATGDYVAYRDISVSTRATTPPVPPPDQPPVPPPDNVPPGSHDINLSDIVVWSTAEVKRSYVKDSMKAIDSQIITVRNTSNDIDVQVQLTGAGGVSFDPSTFPLPRNSTAKFTVKFTPIEVNNLPEGVNTINAVVRLTSTSATVIRL